MFIPGSDRFTLQARHCNCEPYVLGGIWQPGDFAKAMNGQHDYGICGTAPVRRSALVKIQGALVRRVPTAEVAGLIVAVITVAGCGGSATDDQASAAGAGDVSSRSVSEGTLDDSAENAGGGSNVADVVPVAQGPVFGNPQEASEFWVEQSFQDCGLMAVATVVGLLTGNAPTEDEIIAVAASIPDPDGSGDPIYVPFDPDDTDSDNGTSSADQVVLLEHYGISATAVTDDDDPITTGLPALQQYLSAGRKAIVGINAETIWGEDGDHTEDDHSVVVAAVDTDQGIVYLSDSGTGDGGGEQVDINTFETAWEAGDHDLIVTDQAA